MRYGWQLLHVFTITSVVLIHQISYLDLFGFLYARSITFNDAHAVDTLNTFSFSLNSTLDILDVTQLPQKL